MSIKDKIQSAQWQGGFSGWGLNKITKTRPSKELIAYLKEADDKVWFMRTHSCEDPKIEAERQAVVERILSTYNDIPEEGYDNWECGYWNGVMATLRWALGDEEKDNLDT